MDNISNRTEGGKDSAYCYGADGPYSDADNIMGAGSAFTAEDALPWLWAIKLLRMKPSEVWPVMTAYPGSWYKVPPAPSPGGSRW